MEEKNKFYFDDEDEVVERKKKKKKKKKKHAKKAVHKVERKEKNGGEEKEFNPTYLFFALLTFGVLVVLGGAIYAHSQNGKRDWNTMNNSVQVADQMTVQGADNSENVFVSGTEVVDGNSIKSVILTNDTEDKYKCYRFELFSDGKKLYFTCFYPTADKNIILTGVPVGETRMTDVENTISRFTVAKQIKAYREDNVEYVREDEDTEHMMQINWFDGDSIDLGYPNGAGRAVEKYFKELAQWLDDSSRQE